VYRRDSIDATHYPVFHQMEGVRVYSPADWEAAGMDPTAFCEKELKASLEVGGCIDIGLVWRVGVGCVKEHEFLHSTKAGSPTSTGVGASKLGAGHER
jgi:hypothetical protein